MPGLAIAFGRPDHGDDDEGEEEDHDGEELSSEDHDRAKDEAAAEVMDNMHARRKPEFRKALEAFIDLHNADEDKEDAEDDDEDSARDEAEDEDDDTMKL
jgi:hypothetical protein